jgi:hypothetical protein
VVHVDKKAITNAARHASEPLNMPKNPPDHGPGPMLYRRRLARKLCQMRADVRLTLDEAAVKLDRSSSALGRIENAQAVADIHLVRSAMDLYRVYDRDAIDLARAAMRPGWWRAYGARDSGLIGLETDATRLRELALLTLPTLVQTEDYSQALLRSCRAGRSCDRVEDELALRQVRQRRLTQTSRPLALCVLLDESVLHKPVGGVEVMRAQVRHLLDVAAGDSVTMLVLPDSLGAQAGMGGAFTVVEFEDEQDPDIVSISCVLGPRQFDKPAKVTGFVELFEDLRSVALPPADSMDFVQQLGRQLYGV